MTSDLDAMKAKLKDPEENFAETEKENARMGVEEAGVRTVAEVKLVKGAILDLSRSCTSETWGHVHLALTSFLHRVGSADSDHDGYCTICEDARWDTRFSCGHGYCCEQCAHGLVKKKGDAGVLCPVCNEEIEIVQRGDVVGSQPEFVLVEEICVDGILTKILGDWTGRTHGRGRHFGIWLMVEWGNVPDGLSKDPT